MYMYMWLHCAQKAPLAIVLFRVELAQWLNSCNVLGSVGKLHSS